MDIQYCKKSPDDWAKKLKPYTVFIMCPTCDYKYTVKVLDYLANNFECFQCICF